MTLAAASDSNQAYVHSDASSGTFKRADVSPSYSCMGLWLRTSLESSAWEPRGDCEAKCTTRVPTSAHGILGCNSSTCNKISCPVQQNTHTSQAKQLYCSKTGIQEQQKPRVNVSQSPRLRKAVQGGGNLVVCAPSTQWLTLESSALGFLPAYNMKLREH